jgi:hypothetical protein
LGEIQNGLSTAGGWSTQAWVANDHPVAWLESSDLVGGGLEAGNKISLISKYEDFKYQLTSSRRSYRTWERQ